MTGKMIILILAGFTGCSFAASAQQTDWMDGPVEFGPVSQFGSSFYADTNVDWYTTAGEMTCLLANRHTVSSSFSSAEVVCTADIDGDGDLDIIGGGNNHITWWNNLDGSGTSMLPNNVTFSFHNISSVECADIDGNGTMDILGSAEYADAISWWRNDDGLGTSWTGINIDPSLERAYSAHAADIDGDGDLDVVGTALTDPMVFWWENANGMGTAWNENTISVISASGMDLHSGDIDKDGDMDVLVAYGSNVEWYENTDGSGSSWTTHTVSSSVSGASCVYAHDMNDDGNLDILATARWGMGTLWFENDGSSPVNWSEHWICNSGTGYLEAYPADFDGDGDMDVVTAQMDTDLFEWWENTDGSGTGWSYHRICGSFEWPSSVWAGDVNGDDIPDALGTSMLDDNIGWWDLQEYNPVGSFESSMLDTQDSPIWGYIDWNADTPPGTSVAMCVRTFSHPNHPEGWTDTLTVPGSLAGLIPDGNPWVQYAAILQTEDPEVTPVLNDVTISWNLSGIEGSSGSILQPDLHAFRPNPSRGSATVRFSLPESGEVNLVFYDLSGRIVHRTSSREYPPGQNCVMLDGLGEGVYFCRMSCGGFSDVEKLILLR